MDEEWLCQKLENLKIKENQISTLTEILEHLNEHFNLDTTAANRLLNSTEIYDCLDDEITDNSKAVELLTDILSLCVDNLSLNKNNDLLSLLHGALLHERTSVRALALYTIYKKLKKRMADNNGEVGDIFSLPLLHHILLAVQDPETHIGQTASKILGMVLEKYLDEPTVRDAILEALKKGDVVQCRLYDLAVEIGNRSSDNLEKVEFILDHAVSELDNDDDVLLQASILEILGALAKQNLGIFYMERRQVIEVLSSRIELIEHDSLDQLLIPAMMKFFAVRPEKIIEEFPNVMRLIFECFQRGDDLLFPAACETIERLTHTQRCVLLLEKNYASAMISLIESYCDYLRSLPIKLKLVAFNSMRCLFSFEDNISTELSLLLQRWFNVLTNSTNNMQFLMEFIRNPFPDIKYSCLAFIDALCHYTWGIEALRNTAGLLEYLLDRNAEFDASVKEIKFRIITILATSEAFDIQTNMQLRQYANEGPYFVPVVTEIAIERNE